MIYGRDTTLQHKLKITNKEIYFKLCETEGSNIPLFLQYWWMDTVCEGKCWDVALAYGKRGDVTGAMPYLIGSKFGFRYIVQPQLTQYNGPWYRYPVGIGNRKRIQFQYSVDEQLIAHLNGLKLAFYSQCFAPMASSWLPYHWAGFRQTTRYSYRYDDISEPENLLKVMSPKDRREKILSLMPQVDVVTDISPDRFASMFVEYWVLQGKDCMLPQSFLTTVCNNALARGNGMITGLVYKDSKQLIGASFAVYDDKCAYSLMSAFDRRYDKPGVSESLFWSLILKLSGKTKAFDFEGSMNKNIEYFYRSFGARPVPYNHVWRCFNPLLKPVVERIIR